MKEIYVGVLCAVIFFFIVLVGSKNWESTLLWSGLFGSFVRTVVILEHTILNDCLRVESMV